MKLLIDHNGEIIQRGFMSKSDTGKPANVQEQ